NVIETLKLGYSIFAAGLILPVLAAFLPVRWSAPTWGAITAMFAGGAVAAAGRLVPGLAGAADPVLLGTAVNFTVLAASLALARAPRSKSAA
ncbi:MAG: hypothetical protein ABJC61_07055, partial [Acidobacteriota bacterium]